MKQQEVKQIMAEIDDIISVMPDRVRNEYLSKQQDIYKKASRYSKIIDFIFYSLISLGVITIFLLIKTII